MYQRRDAVFLVHPVRWLIVSICLITSVHFDHFVTVAFARLHHCKTPPLPLGRSFETLLSHSLAKFQFLYLYLYEIVHFCVIQWIVINY